MRLHLGPALAALLLAACLSTATGAVIIDQQYTPAVISDFQTIGGGGFPPGQSFTPTLTGLDFVVLNVVAQSGHGSTPPGDYVTEIRVGQGDSGVLLGTSDPVTLATDMPPTAIEFDFPSVVPLVPGTLFSIVARQVDLDDGSNFLVGFTFDAGYPSGSGFGGVPGDYDLYFQEGLRVTPEPTTLVLSAIGLIGLAFVARKRKRS
jgi:PEP-CTERM motif